MTDPTPLTKADFITGDRFLAIAHRNSAQMAYMKMDTLQEGRPIHWRGQLHLPRPALCWISGHSDYPLTVALHDRYKTECRTWFSTNVVYEHPDVHPIPLGITNDCADSSVHRIYGNLDIMLDVLQEARPPALRPVYMNFNVGTYPTERQRVWNLFKDVPWVSKGIHAPSMNGRKSFLREIRAHKFVLCPRGNGIDTHRLWETLYMGSIPIVVRHPALRDFMDLPIAWIDDWSDVTPEWLESEYARITTSAPAFPHEKLRMSHWERKILDACGHH
jgi:hypothetical protein